MLHGRVVYITGAGSGIGRETAIIMAKNNAKVVVSDINVLAGNQTVELIKNISGNAIFDKCDVTVIEEIDASICKSIDIFGRIDVLVNSAGIFKEAYFTNITKEIWDQHIGLNLTATFNSMKTVVPYMIKNNYGSIINISSLDALQGCKGYAAYCAAKAGVLGLTKDAALELACYGIRVNAVAPGIVATNMTKDRVEKNKESYMEKIPLKRIGKPEDIANAILFLSSEMSSYITGQTLNVNGGVRFD